MFSILYGVRPMDLRKASEEFLGITIALHKDQLSEKNLDRLHRKNLLKKLEKFTSIMNTDQNIGDLDTYTSRYILKALNAMLHPLGLCSIFINVMSFMYHFYLYVERHSFRRFSEYFSYPRSSLDYWNRLKVTQYKSFYGDRYGIYAIVNDETSFIGLHAIHHAMVSVVAFLHEPQLEGNTFCELKYSPPLKVIPMEAMPDSLYSISFIAISAYIWFSYVLISIGKSYIERWLDKTYTDYMRKINMEKLISTLQEYVKSRLDGEFLVSVARAISTRDENIITKARRSTRKVVDGLSSSSQESESLMNVTKGKPRYSNTNIVLSTMLYLLMTFIGMSETLAFVHAKTRVHHIWISALEATRCFLTIVLKIRSMIRPSYKCLT